MSPSYEKNMVVNIYTNVNNMHTTCVIIIFKIDLINFKNVNNINKNVGNRFDFIHMKALIMNI